MARIGNGRPFRDPQVGNSGGHQGQTLNQRVELESLHVDDINPVLCLTHPLLFASAMQPPAAGSRLRKKVLTESADEFQVPGPIHLPCSKLVP